MPEAKAFNHHTEFDAWKPNWCGSCTKDDSGDALTACPILMSVFRTNQVPPEWSEGTDGSADRYHCSAFEAAE